MKGSEPRHGADHRHGITVGGALAGFMYALVAGVHKRIDDLRTDLNRLHDDHNRPEEPLGAVGA
jgi:hypothetical protein